MRKQYLARGVATVAAVGMFAGGTLLLNSATQEPEFPKRHELIRPYEPSLP